MRAASLAIAISVATATAAVAASSSPSLSSRFALPADPSVGAALFEERGCVTCHAVGGSSERRGPNLGHLDLRMSSLEAAATLWNHVPGMSQRLHDMRRPWPQVSGGELLNLVAFFTTYQYYLARVGRPGSPSRGEVLFRDKECGSCHTLEAGTKLVGPDLSRYGGGRSVLELAQGMWNHGPAMQRQLEAKLLPRPYFREREMADLLAYLATRGAPAGAVSALIEPGSPARGAELFHARGCDRCHALAGVGGGARPAPGQPVPPDLGRAAEMTLGDYTDIAALMWNHAVPMWGQMQRKGITITKLENTEMADLVAFLFFANFVDEPGDPEIGRQVFESGPCGGCHKATKPAPDTGAQLTDPWAVVAKMWHSAPAMEVVMEREHIEWPKLDPAKMRHLVAYLRQVTASDQFKQSAAKKADRH